MTVICDGIFEDPPLSRDPDVTTASATPTQVPDSIPAECADADRIVALTFQTAFADWPLRFGLVELRRIRHEVAGSIPMPRLRFCTEMQYGGLRKEDGENRGGPTFT